MSADMKASPVRTLADLKVGDTAVIAGRDGRGGEVTVVKVGRLYLTVKHAGGSNERMFRIDTGRGRGDQGIGAPPRLRVPEEAEAVARRSQALDQLREHGIDVRLSQFTTETLEAILAVIPAPSTNEADES